MNQPVENRPTFDIRNASSALAYTITCTTSAGASLHEAPELQQLALNFLATFFSRRHIRAQFSSDFFI